MALIPDDPTQRNALLVGVVAVAGFYLFWDYWYNPRSEELAEVEARIEQLEDQNRRAQILATRGGEELRERLELYERHVGRLEELIPQREEVPRLLNDITRVARDANVEVALMRPEPSEPGTFYSQQSYQLEAVGAYHGVGRFLTQVASLSRIITPIDLEITPFTGQEDAVDVEHPVLARFRIQTYVVPEEGAGAPPEEEPGDGGGP